MIIYSQPKVARIPVIDIGPSFSSSLSDRLSVAREINHACRTTGFFYIAYHGIADSVVDGLFDGARRFFARPPEEKLHVHINKSPCRRGFEGIGVQALDPESPPDLKEGFLLGLDRGPDHPLVRARTPRHGVNNWPADDSDGLRRAGEAYFDATMALGHHLMRLVALSLHMPETTFEGYFRDPDASLRLLHYPPHPEGARFNQLGCGAHTDWGAITILAQDDCGGLEVQAANGDWILAEPIDGTFVVNIGDLLARWTNDLYKSTAHRVLNNRSGRDRYSAALFFDPDYFARIECLPNCQNTANPPRHPACTSGDHKHELYCRSRGMPYTPAPVPEAAVA